MKNFLSLFRSGPADCHLVDDVQDILHSASWWEEKIAATRRVSAHDGMHERNYPVESLGIAPCFGSDEQYQKPEPDVEPYLDALRAWQRETEEFKALHPALYFVWKFGKKDLALALEGIEIFARGGCVDPMYVYSNQGGFDEYREDPRHRPLAKMLSFREDLDGLFGQRFGVHGIGGVDRRYPGANPVTILEVLGASSGLNYFQATTEAYDADRSRGQAILEEKARLFGSILETLQEEHSRLCTYLSEAQEGYDDYYRRQDDQEREQDLEYARASAAERLWR